MMSRLWNNKTLQLHQNPRKPFDEAVQYATQVAQGYLDLLAGRGIPLAALDYLEIGPGADFAPQLILAGHGARVTLADRYLADWDPDYHPLFYRQFLEKWPGEGTSTIKAVLDQGGYDGVVRLVAEPVEDMPSLAAGSFDFVQSNAVLEHVLDLDRSIKEFARITKVGGIHSHQVDFRFHKTFDRPLDHLIRFHLNINGTYGTTTRMPEMIEKFTRYFWIWETEVNARSPREYTEEILHRLPPDSRYKKWAPQVLAAVGGRLWLMRKDDRDCVADDARFPRSQFLRQRLRGSWPQWWK